MEREILALLRRKHQQRYIVILCIEYCVAYLNIQSKSSSSFSRISYTKQEIKMCTETLINQSINRTTESIDRSISLKLPSWPYLLRDFLLDNIQRVGPAAQIRSRHRETWWYDHEKGLEPKTQYNTSSNTAPDSLTNRGYEGWWTMGSKRLDFVYSHQFEFLKHGSGYGGFDLVGMESFDRAQLLFAVGRGGEDLIAQSEYGSVHWNVVAHLQL